MDTLNTCTHSKKDTHPAHPWVSEQRVLALANRSVHSSSCSCSFISLSGSEPERRSGGVIPFHPSFCMFNPLLSIPRSLLATPPSPSHCSCLPPPSLQTSAFLPLHSIDQSLSIPSPHPSFPSPPPSNPSTSRCSSSSSPSSLSPEDKHSTGWPPSPPPSPSRRSVCTGIRLGFVLLRKEGTNQTLICHCILCLMVSREPDPLEAHTHTCTDAHMASRAEQAES